MPCMYLGADSTCMRRTPNGEVNMYGARRVPPRKTRVEDELAIAVGDGTRAEIVARDSFGVVRRTKRDVLDVVS